MIIRPAESHDAVAVAEIYNHYVRTSHATFELDEITSDTMLGRMSGGWAMNYPFFVAVDDHLIGYASGHQFKQREAYLHSIEISIYLRPGRERTGIGTLLYQSLFAAIRDSSFHSVIAGISLPNDASIRLHERFGMKKIAHFREVGFKFGRWIDVGYWQLVLGSPPESSSV